MNENRNLILAIALSMAVLLGWQYFFAKPEMDAAQKAHQAATHAPTAPAVAPGTPEGAAPQLQHALTRNEALAEDSARVRIDTPSVDGSLRLKGARFDDLRLKKYHETVDPKSPEVPLLSPDAAPHPYYAVFGFVAASGENVGVPGETTPWKQVGNNALTPATPVTLSWDDGQGLTFTRTIAVDDKYMFTVRDTVANHGAAKVTLFPYAYVVHDGGAEGKTYYLLHEGFVGVADGTLKDATYKDFKDDKPPQTFSSTGGWVGITDKYWMAAIIPPQNQTFDGTYRASSLGHTRVYQADYRLTPRSIAPGASVTLSQNLFAGAKVVETINHYESSLGIKRFDLAIDWGWFWFLTKPIFWLLDLFYRYFGNFGVAIIFLTLTIKLALFPLADASYKSMSKMKKLQPQMNSIKERFPDDKTRQQQEMMELYKREKVNPVSGCLPMLIQFPIFFSLYKVLYVTIEMWHAPFFGWIHDLSAPDPTSILNLFGLLPYHIPAFVPAFLSIGIWPVLMGFSQFFSTKMNPPPADPVSAKMFTYMPLIFTFMMAGFPAGLVIYWTVSNALSAAQQFVVMKRQGVEVHLVENLKLRHFGRWLSGLLTGKSSAE
ncbi:MAG: membrane protein insertase YidC [Alphaproteobacteria bacterium]|nr:membrane protein insertase YidC [Alphaproteobacteria bacterium]MDE2012860.1 membrane protein insertase YidC [Alphaproteobacteria bacterium]MDE2074266.1 membrane protein insertase YidC [Alphaproteobacteria bacterium]MDE2350295.1 membrane protein insertase YidC [Alphaproteobacteria bacterium]